MRARAYVTTALVLMLVLVAVHFSIQSLAQQQAQQWVAAWEKQHGGHVDTVRLRMLRGALTLRDMQWQSAGVQFYTPFILLRGNLSDSIEHVDIRELALQGAKLTISNELFYQLIQQKVNLTKLLPWAGSLDGVKHIDSDDMALFVQAGAQGALPLQPMQIQHASFSGHPKQLQWRFLGNVWGGNIKLSSQQGEQQLRWSNLDAESVTASLGLTAIDGSLNGKSSWKQGHISGDIEWLSRLASKDKTVVQTASLAFQWSLRKSIWQGDVTASDWPLQVFSGSAPVLHHRVLNTAYLSGAMHVKHGSHAWQLSMAKGHVRHLNYASESKAAWTLHDIDFKHAALAWPQRTLRIEEIAIAHGQWAVDSTKSSATTKLPAWQLDFPKVTFQDLKFGDIAKNIWLPDVQGKLSMQHQYVNIKVNSQSQAMGTWQLQAIGDIGEEVNLTIKVQAEDVPLLNFRDAMPHSFVNDARLNGDISLDLRGAWNSEGWQLHGDMDGQNIMWNRGAWLWRAEHMQLKGITFGSEQMPHVDTWQVHNWAGQTSLTPWSQVSHGDIAQEQQLLPFSLDGWQLKHIHIGYGKFSLGKKDAVWFASDIIKFDGIEADKPLAMWVQGSLAEGRLNLKGEWFPWGRTPWVSLHVSLKHALPFAAAPWLQLSGLPMFSRGRISAEMNINPISKQSHQYQGRMRLHLRHGQLQDGISSNQLLSESTGYEGHSLFDRINKNGDIDLSIPLHGNWVYTPLSSAMLGQGLLAALAKKASLDVPQPRKKAFTPLYSIRLHDSLDGRADSLKHNERVRLRKVIHVLQRQKKWLVELQPQLGKEVLNEQLIGRVRQTQEQITAFLVTRGISPARIFPVWPEESNRQGESTGILIQAVK